MKLLKTLALSTVAGLSCVALLNADMAVANDYNIELNKTEIIHLPVPASAIAIGNPEIADVTVHSRDTLFIIGRGYGTTNLVILDSAGKTIINADIKVNRTQNSNEVKLRLGTERQSYQCSPDCEPAPVLGDSPAFISRFGSTASQIINTSAAPAQGIGAVIPVGGIPGDQPPAQPRDLSNNGPLQ